MARRARLRFVVQVQRGGSSALLYGGVAPHVEAERVEGIRPLMGPPYLATDDPVIATFDDGGGSGCFQPPAK